MVDIADGGSREAQREATKPVIVGIGASAGGIQALQTFFDALPDDTGAAFVVIVHLDPQSRSELPSILATRTRMPVVPGRRRRAAWRRTTSTSFRPTASCSISDHEISTAEFDEPRGRRAPIDLFFRSLAGQHGDGFAVVLTGAGVGRRRRACGRSRKPAASSWCRIRPRPNTPRCRAARSPPGSPTSCCRSATSPRSSPSSSAARQHVDARCSEREIDEELLRRILAHLRVRTGHDFSQYKRSTVMRRDRAPHAGDADRRPRRHTYAFLRDNAEEAQALFADLLISVTTFFRDPEAFEALGDAGHPQLFDGKEPSDADPRLGAGCATGEEAYTHRDAAARGSRRATRSGRAIQVFGSDLDAGALAIAREGRYPAAIEADVSEERLRRFFVREGDHYRVRRELRDIVLFASHSLLKDPPFSRLDLDLLPQSADLSRSRAAAAGLQHLPLRAEPRRLPVPRLVGDAPTTRRACSAPSTAKARIYQSTGAARRQAAPAAAAARRCGRGAGIAPARAGRRRQRGAQRGGAASRRRWRSWRRPACWSMRRIGSVHLSENAGRFLQPSGGPLTSDVAELVRPELRFELRSALHRAFERGEPTLSLPIPVRFNGAPHRVYLQVRPVGEDERPTRATRSCCSSRASRSRRVPAQVRTSRPRPTKTVRRLREELRAHAGAAADDARGIGGGQRGAARRQRGAAIDQRGVPLDRRGARDQQGGAAVDQRGAADRQQRAEAQARDGLARPQRPAEPDGGHRCRHAVPRRRAAHQALHAAASTDLFNITPSDEGRPITDFTQQLDYDGFVADAAGRARRTSRRSSARSAAATALVPHAPAALSHGRRQDRRRGRHLRRHHRAARRSSRRCATASRRLQREKRLVELSRDADLHLGFRRRHRRVEPGQRGAVRLHAARRRWASRRRCCSARPCPAPRSPSCEPSCSTAERGAASSGTAPRTAASSPSRRASSSNPSAGGGSRSKARATSPSARLGSGASSCCCAS